MQDPPTDKEPDLIIRASSFSTLWDCSARFKAIYLEGKRTPSGAASVVGTATHRGTAVYDLARITEGATPSIGEAVEAAADAARNPESEVRWDDFKPGEAVDIAAKLTLKYCNDIAPLFTYRRVEMKLNSFDVSVDNGITIRFTGHVDRQYTQLMTPEFPEDDLHSNAYGTLDFKTGKQVVKADGTVNVAVSAAQLGTYELLELMASNTEQVPHVLPAKIIALPTAGKQQPKIVDVENPRNMLIGDEQHKGLIEIAADIYKHDLFVGNPRSMLCGEKYCPVYHNCRWRAQGDQ